MNGKDQGAKKKQPVSRLEPKAAGEAEKGQADHRQPHADPHGFAAFLPRRYPQQGNDHDI